MIFRGHTLVNQDDWTIVIKIITQVVLLFLRFTSRGPISAKFPKPTEEPPGPPCELKSTNESSNWGSISMIKQKQNPIDDECIHLVHSQIKTTPKQIF